MLFGWPAGHVGADFADQVLRGLRADGIDLAQISAAGEPMQRAADIEPGLMLGSPLATRFRQWCRRWRLLDGQGSEQPLDFAIALCDLLEQELIGGEVLL